MSKFEMEENDMSLDVCVYYHVHTYMYILQGLNSCPGIINWSDPTMRLLVCVTSYVYVYTIRIFSYFNQSLIIGERERGRFILCVHCSYFQPTIHHWKEREGRRFILCVYYSNFQPTIHHWREREREIYFMCTLFVFSHFLII